MPYDKVYVQLSSRQIKKLKKAVESASPIKLRLKRDNLIDGNIPLMLTLRQQNKILKSIRDGTGTMLTLSESQLAKMRAEGGILAALAPFLLAAATGLISGAAAPVGQLIFDKIKGTIGKIGQGLVPLGYGLDEEKLTLLSMLMRKPVDIGLDGFKPEEKALLHLLMQPLPSSSSGSGIFPLGVRDTRL